MRSLFQYLLAVILAAFFVAGPAEAHTIRLPGLPNSTDPIVSTDSSSCIIPFTRVGNLILVQASIDTTTGYFVLDTGTPGLVLNITYFRRYATRRPADGGGITGSADVVCRTYIDSLRLGPVHYSRMEADLIDLGHIENNKGVKILGLLGMRLFERMEVIIDYSARLIFLHQIARKDPAGYRNPQLADTSTYQTIPIQIEDGKIIVYVFVNGKRLKFIIDSGAETNVLDSRLPNKVFQAVEIRRRVTLDGIGQSKVDAFYGNIKNLRIGDRDIGSLPVLITNLETMCTAYNDNCIDGMFGFDFLSLHKIGFNFVDRKMYIWK